MKRKKAMEVDEDGIVTPKTENNNEPLEAFVNHDLLEDFFDVYEPGTKYNFTHILSRQQLRQMFGATIDFNTVDPLPAYIEELSIRGYKEKISPSGEPCIYVVEKELLCAEVVEEDEPLLLS